MVYRVCVEKKPGLAPECASLLSDCRSFLDLKSLENVRIWNRYDIEGIDETLFAYATNTVFSEPQLDLTSGEIDASGAAAVFAVEPLPGQFDQRADSAAQCIQLLSQGERPRIRTAKVYALYGTLSEKDVEAVKHHVINPVESREASLAKPETLEENLSEPKPVASVDGFTGMDESALSVLLSSMGLAMDLDDLRTLQAYFRDEEHRDPTVTEVRVVDTYWSDHCRHTTFSTHLDEVSIENPAVKDAYDRYLAAREEVYGIEKAAKRPQTLMDIATIGTKTLKKRGLLPELDESEEINACSIHVPAKVNGEEQDWLLMFKNETHNTPPKSNPSAARPPASEAASATRSPAALMSIRRCASPAAATRERRSRRRFPESSPSASWRRPRRRDIRPTATRSALPRAMSPSSTTRATLPNALSAARSSPRRPPRTLCASVPPRATSLSCSAAARAVTASAARPVRRRATI